MSGPLAQGQISLIFLKFSLIRGFTIRFCFKFLLNHGFTIRFYFKIGDEDVGTNDFLHDKISPNITFQTLFRVQNLYFNII